MMAKSLPVYDATKKDIPRFTRKAGLWGVSMDVVIPPCQRRSRVRGLGWSPFPFPLFTASALKPPGVTYKKGHVMLSAFLVSREQPRLLEETVFQNLLFSQACGEIPCKATPLNLVIFTKGTAEDWVNKHMHTFKKSPVHLLRPHSPD